jgi:P27 family predicted phage terminase small subunit
VYGREHWSELAPVLSRAGLLTEGDRAALAQLCDDYATIRRSIDPPDASSAGEFDRMRSLMSSADRARDRYRRMLIEFGMTPSSRSKLGSPAPKPKDDLEEFLATRKAE